MMPKLKEATVKARSRVHERERAMDDIRTFVADAQSILKRQKNWAANQWRQVEEEEANIDRLYAIKKLQQHEYYEEQKMVRTHESSQVSHFPFHHSSPETEARGKTPRRNKH